MEPYILRISVRFYLSLISRLIIRSNKYVFFPNCNCSTSLPCTDSKEYWKIFKDEEAYNRRNSYYYTDLLFEPIKTVRTILRCHHFFNLEMAWLVLRARLIVSQFVIGDVARSIKKIYRDQFEGAEITSLYTPDIIINDGIKFFIRKFQFFSDSYYILLRCQSGSRCRRWTRMKCRVSRAEVTVHLRFRLFYNGLRYLCSYKNVFYVSKKDSIQI